MSKNSIFRAYQEGALVLVANLGVQHQQIEALQEENRALKQTNELTEGVVKQLKGKIEQLEKEIGQFRIEQLQKESDRLCESLNIARIDERNRIARWLEDGAGEKEQHWNRVYAKKLRELE